jgi:hypothetical protein
VSFLNVGFGVLLGSLAAVSPLPAQTSKPVRALQVKPGTPSQPSAQEARVALVIGNGAYADAPLRNPVNDARAMAAAMKQCGFAVTRLENATRPQMREGIRAFGARIAEGGVGLFYFAGHGMAVKGRNYLIPVGADIAGEDEVEGEAVEVDAILAKMETARNRLNIVILDACRNNPFGHSFRSTQQGLAQVDAPTGTFVAFATAPGRTAADGAGANGLYTEALLRQLRTPGLTLEAVFKQTRAEVLKGSGQQQTPWENSSIVGDFFFVPGAGSSAPGPAAASAPSAAPAQAGNLQVAVNAPDTEVYVGGTLAGTASPAAPLNLRALPVGDVQVKVTAKGYASAEMNLSIQPGKWTQTRMYLIPDAQPADEPGNAKYDAALKADKVKWQEAWAGTWQPDPSLYKAGDNWGSSGSITITPSGDAAISLAGNIDIWIETPGLFFGKSKQFPMNLRVDATIQKDDNDFRLNDTYTGPHVVAGAFQYNNARADKSEFQLLGIVNSGQPNDSSLPKMGVKLPGGGMAMLVKVSR